jgi:hypothetical protein
MLVSLSPWVKAKSMYLLQGLARKSVFGLSKVPTIKNTTKQYAERVGCHEGILRIALLDFVLI